MKAINRIILSMALVIFVPLLSHAQVTGPETGSLRKVLEQLYNDMIPLCSQLIGVGQAIAGFAATWYIGSRVWRHIANAEPIDFYPLFRPFVLGFCIMIFPSVLGIMNGVLQPTVTATSAMVEDSNNSIEALLELKRKAMLESPMHQMYYGNGGFGDRDMFYRYLHDNADPSQQGLLESIGTDVQFAIAKASYAFRSMVREWVSELLQIAYETAALCIDTLRTFQLVVLAILGPLVFGLAVFDGFEHTLTSWMARYINIFLWMPVANIFGSIIGKVQQEMLKVDLHQIEQHGDTVFNRTDVPYIAFLIIGIVGYFTVPSVANYIVQTGGNALTQKVTGVLGKTTRIGK